MKKSKENLKDFLGKARAGENEALNYLYETRRDYINATYCSCIIENFRSQYKDEYLSKVKYQMYVAVKSFDESRGRSFDSYMNVVVTNTARKILRKVEKYNHEVKHFGDLSYIERIRLQSRNAFNLEEYVIKKSNMKEAFNYLKTVLNKNELELLMSVYHNKESLKEFSIRTHCKYSTVRSRIRRISKKVDYDHLNSILSQI